MSTLQQVIKMIEHKGYSGEMQPDTQLGNDLGLDSLDFAELSLEIDQAYGVDTPQEMWSEGVTIGDIVLFIENSTK